MARTKVLFIQLDQDRQTLTPTEQNPHYHLTLTASQAIGLEQRTTNDSPLWSFDAGTLWWRVVVRHSERGAHAQHTDRVGKVSANFLKSQLQSWFQPTDNRLAMKLFGSRKALVKERIRQKTSGHWVIHPCSSFRWVPTINTERSRDMSSTNPMISYISIQVLLGPLHAFIISSKSYYPASRNIILQRWSEHTMDCLQLPKWYYFFNRYCSQF